MRISKANVVLTGLLIASLPLITVSAFAKTHPNLRRGVVSHMHKTVKSGRMHESAGMPSERATEIQTALIKQGYLNGEPTGVWDSQSSAAMAKLQGDNGWQTKVTPDSRALIKLGLGPTAPPADQVVASK
jgi:peptidoglycan hydrolase-like protein with peptidoglycan-binding domain